MKNAAWSFNMQIQPVVMAGVAKEVVFFMSIRKAGKSLGEADYGLLDAAMVAVE
jgi:hypothetical protein